MTKSLGVYDSGLGGFSLLKGLNHYKNLEGIYYFSDSERMPYGNLSPEALLERGSEITEHLLKSHVDAILVACNTATVNSINSLRDKFDVPFIGIEPYVNALHKENLNGVHGRVGLLVTPATYNSKRFEWLKSQFDPDDKMIYVPHKTLALEIETLLRSSESNQKSENFKKLHSSVADIATYGLDALVLGCTHYPLIKDILEEHLQIPILDPTEHVIKQVEKVLSLETIGPETPSNEQSFNRWELYYSESISQNWQSFEFQKLRNIWNYYNISKC